MQASLMQNVQEVHLKQSARCLSVQPACIRSGMIEGPFPAISCEFIGNKMYICMFARFNTWVSGLPLPDLQPGHPR